MLRKAGETDQAEDRQHGSRCGDELPAELVSSSGRPARLQQAKAHYRPRRRDEAPNPKPPPT